MNKEAAVAEDIAAFLVPWLLSGKHPGDDRGMVTR